MQKKIVHSLPTSQKLRSRHSVGISGSYQDPTKILPSYIPTECRDRNFWRLGDKGRFFFYITLKKCPLQVCLQKFSVISPLFHRKWWFSVKKTCFWALLLGTSKKWGFSDIRGRLNFGSQEWNRWWKYHKTGLKIIFWVLSVKFHIFRIIWPISSLSDWFLPQKSSFSRKIGIFWNFWKCDSPDLWGS